MVVTDCVSFCLNLKGKETVSNAGHVLIHIVSKINKSYDSERVASAKC